MRQTGWSPVIQIDKQKKVMFVKDWVGGEGEKPTIGGYIGPNGFVENIKDATKIRDLRYDSIESANIKPNWLSIIKAKNCFFSRRSGVVGKIIFGYSVRLRIFGKEII